MGPRRVWRIMTRPAIWTAMLAGYLEEARQTPFAWGRHDCVSFAAGWFCLMTGRDTYAPWRGRYSTRFGAARHIYEAGARDMIAAGTILFGASVKEKVLINRGDIVLAQNAFGIVTGPGAVFLKEGGGLAELKRGQFVMGWAV